MDRPGHKEPRSKPKSGKKHKGREGKFKSNLTFKLMVLDQQQPHPWFVCSFVGKFEFETRS